MEAFIRLFVSLVHFVYSLEQPVIATPVYTVVMCIAVCSMFTVNIHSKISQRFIIFREYFHVTHVEHSVRDLVVN